RHCGHPPLPRVRQHHHDRHAPGGARHPLRPARTPRTSGHHRSFAFSPPTAATVPEISTALAHLRDVLGDQIYESLARQGERMSTTAIVTYAYDQIDQARAELKAV